MCAAYTLSLSTGPPYLHAGGCMSHQSLLCLRDFRNEWPLSGAKNKYVRSLNAASALSPVSLVQSTKACDVFDVHEQLVPYAEARLWQQHLVAQRLAGNYQGSSGAILLLQHPPVFTMGAGSSTEHLRFNLEDPPLPLHWTERGGEVTYHGPGQLVMYPIINLQQFEPDLHWYLRSLEEVVIRALRNVSGLTGERVNGLTGVWVGDSKVAAIGIRARRWVTYHGLALNITTDLGPYQYIVPCGISDRSVASVAGLLGEESPGLLQDYSQGLLDAFTEVFGVTLQKIPSLRDSMFMSM